MLLAQNDAHANDRDASAAIESAPLFTGIPQEDFERISAAAQLKWFARDEMLYLEGDKVEHVFLLISGLVKVTQLEVILRLVTPGDVLDAVGLCSTGRHCTTAQVIRVCRALVWDAKVFKGLMCPVLHQNRLICGHLQVLEERLREVAT
jgi:CRP-like cAMP-binding protein